MGKRGSGSGAGAGGGIGVGAVIAALLSAAKGNTLLWVGVHAVLGWLYVFYVCLGGAGGFPPSDAPLFPQTVQVEESP